MEEDQAYNTEMQNNEDAADYVQDLMEKNTDQNMSQQDDDNGDQQEEDEYGEEEC